MCLLFTVFSDFTGGDVNVIAPKLIAVVLTAGVHFWKRNTLLSISAGTISYMLLIHFVLCKNILHAICAGYFLFNDSSAYNIVVIINNCGLTFGNCLPRARQKQFLSDYPEADKLYMVVLFILYPILAFALNFVFGFSMLTQLKSETKTSFQKLFIGTKNNLVCINVFFAEHT